MKQCKEYYKALEGGDSIGMHYLYIPEPTESPLSREFRERSKQNWEAYKAEQKYLENLPEDFVGLEVEYQISKRCQSNEYQENERKSLRKTLMRPLIFILTTLVVCLVEMIIINQM